MVFCVLIRFQQDFYEFQLVMQMNWLVAVIIAYTQIGKTNEFFHFFKLFWLHRLDNQLFNKCRRYAKDYCHVQGRWHEQTSKSTPSGQHVMSCLYRLIKDHRKEVWLRGKIIILCKMFSLINGTCRVYLSLLFIYVTALYVIDWHVIRI